MTKDLLFELSTGDKVKNVKTGQVLIVITRPPENNQYLISIEQVSPIEDWELERSRLLVTKEELLRLEEYHKKLDEQARNQR